MLMKIKINFSLFAIWLLFGAIVVLVCIRLAHSSVKSFQRNDSTALYLLATSLTGLSIPFFICSYAPFAFSFSLRKTQFWARAYTQIVFFVFCWIFFVFQCITHGTMAFPFTSTQQNEKKQEAKGRKQK